MNVSVTCQAPFYFLDRNEPVLYNSPIPWGILSSKVRKLGHEWALLIVDQSGLDGPKDFLSSSRQSPGNSWGQAGHSRRRSYNPRTGSWLRFQTFTLWLVASWSESLFFACWALWFWLEDFPYLLSEPFPPFEPSWLFAVASLTPSPPKPSTGVSVEHCLVAGMWVFIALASVFSLKQTLQLLRK